MRCINLAHSGRGAEPDAQSRMSLSQGRVGGGGDTEDDRAERTQGDGLARPEQRTLTHERKEVCYARNRYEWSPTEQAVIREVGRFRTLEEQDVERVFYRANPKQFQADLDHLSNQGLLLRRSVSVGKKGEVRRVVVLSKRAKRLAQHHRSVPEEQAVGAGFVEPSEVSQAASIYKMYEAEVAQIEAAGGRFDRVVLDFESKKKIYGELNKKGAYGDLSYAGRQEDLELYELPIVDGKTSLPGPPIEHETADGERAHVDLELATENYGPAHMSQKVRAGFKIYDVNSTSRGPSRRVRRSRTDGGHAGLMSTPVMTLDERIDHVQGLQYARAEAESLFLVALHGGYFVRRQFDAWIDVERGKRSEDFVADLLDRSHCRRQVFAHNRQVFHLRFRPLYRAVGDENSRNRREHQPQAVKARLMTLDFVLAHPENRYFATEREQVQHLCGERGIAPDALPAKAFPSADGSALTRGYFLDRFPPFTCPGYRELAFCYVGSGFETSGPFASHLRRYLPLFAELPSFELVYVTTSSTRLGQAQSVFERVLSRGRKWLTKVADPERLLAHFRDRKLFEKRDTSDFDRLGRHVLRDHMDCFSGRYFAQMFVNWESAGDEAIRSEIAAQKMPNGRLSSSVLPHDYDLFGRVEEAS